MSECEGHTVDPLRVLMLIGFAALTMALVIVGFATFTNHGVTRYYVGGGQSYQKGYCVLADIPWAVDDLVYCSDNIANTKTMMLDLNAALLAAPVAAPK